MPDANSLIVFMLATVTLNITPGPDMLYVIARSIEQGRSAGIASAFGIAAGCVVHLLAVTLGLAGLLAAVPAAYQIVKYAGAAYLVYLGVRVLINRQSSNGNAQLKQASLRAAFLQGAVTNILNPKVALFFLAFLPQFVNRAEGHVAGQLILLGILFNTSGTLVNVGVAMAASYTGDRFKSRVKNSAVFRWLTGGIFIALGLRLALLENRR
jgi:threonine/homoserine/homoserine lactone efflux protein